LIDQATAAYLRSDCPRPSQADLDELFRTSTGVEVMELVFEARVGKFQPRLILTGPADLVALQTALAIADQSCGHLMTFGDVCLVFHRLDRTTARIEVVAGIHLRWTDRWQDDARLADPRALADVLASRGFMALRVRIERVATEEQERATEYAGWLKTWEPAIPVGLHSLVQDLGDGRDPTNPTFLAGARSALAEHYPSVDSQILVLLAWYGHGSGPWSGFPSVEQGPASLLEAFSADEFVQALDGSSLSRQHLEGAARFVARWVPIPDRRTHRKLIDRVRASGVRGQILEYVRSTGERTKIKAVESALA
jgi:hypothetical protein